ncbi:hypothetical protein HY968_03480 [Candidatus Kaiserbacteria bacterium]|nr:hypothetical protein [Candidatus Kaiserbacteria bacterium]
MEKKTVDALRWIVNLLNKYGIVYQISGGFAAKLYGSSRPVNDIDIDLSQRHFHVLLPEISQYITYGPARFNDGKWDVELITLNYNGQEIDLSGADDTRITNKERTAWIPYPNDISRALTLTVEGEPIKVMHPRDLALYKSLLDGDHQKSDIDAAIKYADEHGL